MSRWNRPFARSGHMVQNHTCLWASCTAGLPKQCHSYQSTWTCLCFGSPTAELPYQHVIVQKAYPELLYKQFNKSPYIIISESFLFVFWSFVKSTDTELKVHELHYENALIARVGPSFQKILQTRPYFLEGKCYETRQTTKEQTKMLRSTIFCTFVCFLLIHYTWIT